MALLGDTVTEMTKHSGSKANLKQNIRIHNYNAYKICISNSSFVTQVSLKSVVKT
jgi:hypothetical protein